MTITYTKEKFYRTGDTTELTFASFFNLVDELVQSNTIRLGPKYRIHNQLAFYSKKDGEVIVLYTIHTTSDNDDQANISKCIHDLLAKEPDKDYYVATTYVPLKRSSGEDKGKTYPGIQLYGQDRTSEDNQQEKTKKKIYEINFGEPKVSMTGLNWLHEVHISQ